MTYDKYGNLLTTATYDPDAGTRATVSYIIDVGENGCLADATVYDKADYDGQDPQALILTMEVLTLLVTLETMMNCGNCGSDRRSSCNSNGGYGS